MVGADLVAAFRDEQPPRGCVLRGPLSGVAVVSDSRRAPGLAVWCQDHVMLQPALARIRRAAQLARAALAEMPFWPAP